MAKLIPAYLVIFSSLVVACTSQSFNSEELGDAEDDSAVIEDSGHEEQTVQDSGVCVAGDQRSCACYGEEGHQTCLESGAGYGLCRNQVNACCGAPNGWLGCGNTGCGVCVEAFAGFPKYLANHPDCFAASGCVLGAYGVPGAYGACSAACPTPSDADK